MAKSCHHDASHDGDNGSVLLTELSAPLRLDDVMNEMMYILNDIGDDGICTFTQPVLGLPIIRVRSKYARNAPE